jgi:predicted Rdx family selenoprotein
MDFQPRFPGYEAKLRASFARQTIMRTFGAEMVEVAQHSGRFTASPPCAGFLVFRRHVEPGLPHRLDAIVERHEMRAVAPQRQRGRRDRLDRAQPVALDAGHLHQPPAGSQVMPR